MKKKNKNLINRSIIFVIRSVIILYKLLNLIMFNGDDFLFV